VATPPLAEHVFAWDPDDLEATKKVFTHLWSADGAVRLTKGAGGDLPHHRGLFVGYNRTRLGDVRQDFWHCPLDAEGRGPTIRHDRFLTAAELGDAAWRTFASEFPDARHQRFGALARWVAADGVAWVAERRVVHAAAVDGFAVFDVDVTLQALVGPLSLDGDPHHAGLQVRLAQEVHDRADETTYLRPEGAVDQGNDVWADCEWAALLQTIGDRRMMVVHVDHPANPVGRYSTRPYGRFGSCAPIELEEGASVRLRCRILVLEDEEVEGDDLWRAVVARLAEQYRG